MKLLLILSILLSNLFASKVIEVDKKYISSKKCKTCHIHIVKEWKQSWHYKSHYNNDEYFRATIDYISRKTRKSLNSVKIQCARCHNPRIAVTSTDMNYELESIMDLNINKEIDKAVNSEVISEGINCIVCHNIDKIHTNKDSTVRGLERVEWTQSGTMIGPFDDAVSPYHQTKQRDFMDKDPNTLCFVCHANDRAIGGLIFTNMEEEYGDNQEKCVDCHMGPKKAYVAATFKQKNGKAKPRDIRSHKFQGAHVESFLLDALSLSLKEENDLLYITLINKNPHNIPSGFGSRELIIDLIYKKNKKFFKKETLSLTRYYIRKGNKPSIAHLAISASKDTSVPAKGEKVVTFKKVKGATSVEVKVYYRLVNDEVRSLLKLKEPIWSQKSLITTGSLELK